MKKYIVVTGGAGFVGSNLIEYLLKKKLHILSIDNYSSGSTKNHVNNPNVKYYNANTEDINKVFLIIGMR